MFITGQIDINTFQEHIKYSTEKEWQIFNNI